jgi:hypothetical protein
MKKIFITGLLASITSFLCAQNIDKILNAKEAERIEKILSDNNMEGRKVFTPGIDRAAAFIASEFNAIGLQPAVSGGGYLQSFSLVRSTPVSASATLDGNSIEAKNIVIVTPDSVIKITPASGYEKGAIKAGENLFSEASKYAQSGKNYVVLVDTSFAQNACRA